jgi:hypothetical protein
VEAPVLPVRFHRLLEWRAFDRVVELGIEFGWPRRLAVTMVAEIKRYKTR